MKRRHILNKILAEMEKCGWKHTSDPQVHGKYESILSLISPTEDEFISIKFTRKKELDN